MDKKIQNSDELRSLNFRIINEGLSFDLNLKFTFKKQKKCNFCKKEVETAK